MHKNKLKKLPNSCRQGLQLFFFLKNYNKEKILSKTQFSDLPSHLQISAFSKNFIQNKALFANCHCTASTYLECLCNFSVGPISI